MSEGGAERRKAVALRGKAQRRLSGEKHGDGNGWQRAGDATQSVVTAMIGTATAVIGEARVLQCRDRESHAAAMHSIAWAKHRSATQRQGIATRSATQRQWLATQRRGKGVALLGDGMA